MRGMVVVVCIGIALAVMACATGTTGGRPSLSSEEKEALLRERVTAMWNAMVNKDRGTEYDLYDPFFRSRANKEVFKAVNVPLFHYDPEIKKIDIKGNVATVRVKFEYEVKGLRTPSGRELNQARRETMGTETWIFVDDNWYREYINNITETSAVPY